MPKLASEVEVSCPCCDATLIEDVSLGRVVSFQQHEREDKPELGDAHRILSEEKARREALFEQSINAEKARSSVLEKRFEEALEQAKKDPIERPSRDFDLD